jgi:hypothetical protein
MAKLVVLVKGNAHADFVHWYRYEFAARTRKTTEGISQWTMSIVDPAKGDADFDVVSELWGDPSACAAVHASDAFLKMGRALEYSVEEFVEKGACDPSHSSGVKVIGCVLPVIGHTREQTRSYWDAHVPLALDVHVGISRYVRNWVIAAKPDLPGFFGFPMLYFPTEADFRERYFGPGDARKRHAADIGQFVGRAVKLISTEHAVGAM